MNESTARALSTSVGRRSFLKMAAVASVFGATGVTSVQASSSTSKGSNGVVKGKSPKKEITYTKTQTWEDYYKSAL